MRFLSRLVRWLFDEPAQPDQPDGHLSVPQEPVELVVPALAVVPAEAVSVETPDPPAALPAGRRVQGSVRRQDLANAHADSAARQSQGAPRSPPARRRRTNFDSDESMTVILEGPDEEILWSIGRRIEAGRFELPTLPSTSMSVIELANNPSVEFSSLVGQISVDPVLSSELLRTANSVMFAGEEPVDTLHSAIVRIGLRALRSMILSVSMRGTILRSGVLAEYAEDVWSQSHSVALTARAIAPVLGVDPERAFLLGLLQDVGKIALIAMLSKECKGGRVCSPELVGRVFQAYHQTAGAAMARKWRLPAELISVAGCHHEWQDNEEFARAAALANLAHHIELAQSLRDPKLLSELSSLPSLLFLAPQEETRQRLLSIAHASPEPEPALPGSYAGDSPSSSESGLPSAAGASGA